MLSLALCEERLCRSLRVYILFFLLCFKFFSSTTEPTSQSTASRYNTIFSNCLLENTTQHTLINIQQASTLHYINTTTSSYLTPHQHHQHLSQGEQNKRPSQRTLLRHHLLLSVGLLPPYHLLYQDLIPDFPVESILTQLSIHSARNRVFSVLQILSHSTSLL